MKPEPDDEDSRLFREAMSDVKPLSHVRPTAKPRKPISKARRLPFKARRDHRVVLEEHPVGAAHEPVAAGDEVSFRRPGVQTAVLRKLRRGEYGVQASIDLHGLTAEQAERALQEFLSHAVGRGVRSVRIIHGKGLRTGAAAPVLKNTVVSALRRMSVVIAFVSARREDGGTGAVYALLGR